ncbi:glycosyl transferase [Marinicauda pacifica]|nr:glycosyl transferase [Marinicauda pacifica]
MALILFPRTEQSKNFFSLTSGRGPALTELMSRLVVIIPALDAACHLPATLEGLEEGVRSGLVAGWVLADGGSADTTRELARRAGFHLVTGPRGRGPQLIAGAQVAAGLAGRDDWYLFLHADTRLEPGWSAEVRRVMGGNSLRAWAFRFALDAQGAPARRLTRGVNWRSAALKLPYGDQGLLISREFYEQLGGYRPLALFEDVDLVRRIGRRRLSILRSRAVTSAQRFARQGYAARSARNLTLLARYYLGADPARLARAYSR